MVAWFIFVVLVSLCVAALLRVSLFSPRHVRTEGRSLKLPPGPRPLPLLGNLLWLRGSFSELQPLLRRLHAEHGPILTLHLGSRPSIFVASRSLAHRALILHGAVFADRPLALLTGRIYSSRQHTIVSAFYGPTWRCLHRNLTSELLHPSRLKSHSASRRRALRLLLRLLEAESRSGRPVLVNGHFQYAMFSLLVSMCFGNTDLLEKKLQDVAAVQRRQLLSFNRFSVLNLWPRVGKILFSKRWKEFMQLRKDQEDLLVPLIRARAKTRQEDVQDGVVSYLDTLLDLRLPDEKRNLNMQEMVSLCSEFLNAGTDTTSTALQWIMANMVKYPHVQEKLFAEINGVVGGEAEVKEEDLKRMPYLKATVLEGLRRHPPTHLVLPHAVTQDVELGGYVVPKNAVVNFMVAEMGRDPEAWKDPMEFRPERFLGSGEGHGGGEGLDFDLTGSREIRMMPFGAGRRMCPGYGLALLHLEYFVANLVRHFRWTTAGGGGEDEVNLSETLEFTFVMKYPLRAHLCGRQ